MKLLLLLVLVALPVSLALPSASTKLISHDLKESQLAPGNVGDLNCFACTSFGDMFYIKNTTNRGTGISYSGFSLLGSSVTSMFFGDFKFATSTYTFVAYFTGIYQGRSRVFSWDVVSGSFSNGLTYGVEINATGYYDPPANVFFRTC